MNKEIEKEFESFRTQLNEKIVQLNGKFENIVKIHDMVYKDIDKLYKKHEIKKIRQCQGLIGRIFGHNFKSLIIKCTAPKGKLKFGAGYGHEEMIDSLSDKEYKIICKRCGEEK